jgi:hypothetical protein
MKIVLVLLLLIGVIRVNGQNEFAASAFFEEFKKIYADAQKGFTENKGVIRESEYPGLTEEFNSKLQLPLADSGKVVVPIKGNPYLIYYFEPEKVRLKIDLRGANLRDAIVMSMNQPLYSRTESTVADNRPFSNTWYFLKPDETRKTDALFVISIYFKENKYYLSLEIRGKKE